MKKKFIEDKKFRLIVMLLVTVFIVTSFSFAWFIMRATDETQNFSVANFQAEPYCYFKNGENEVLPENIELTDEKGNPITDEEGNAVVALDDNGLIVLSTNPGDDNYIGNFCVDVKYKGDGAGYLRVKMVHEYSINGMSNQHPANVPYKIADEGDWHDNRGDDYCYYYKNELDADGDAEQTLSFITANNDIDLGALADGIVIKVAVETDMVQINRYPQIWGMGKLPWEP
ncbi:MAG: hypothetical protein E7555_02965 [Ruminococcaceae bacterium]|nr:hypothetical protein [Oscillospiraceae bacterium]